MMMIAPVGGAKHRLLPSCSTIALLAALALILGAAFCLGLPFALQAGAEFFLPLTAAIVIAIALVPLLEWLERRGLPSALAAFFALVTFLAIINAALAIIVVPATGWFARIPESIPRIQSNLAPLIDFYSTLQRFVDRTLMSVASGTEATAQAVAATACAVASVPLATDVNVRSTKRCSVE